MNNKLDNERIMTNKELFKKLFKYLKPHKRFAIFTIILAALSNVMTLGFPFMMQQLINNGITKGDLDYIKNIGIVMIILCIIAMFISIAFRGRTQSGAAYSQGKITLPPKPLKIYVANGDFCW